MPSLRQRINRTLTQTTGYQLVRADGPKEGRAETAAAARHDELTAALAAQQKSLDAIRAAQRPAKPARPKLPADYDDFVKATVEAVRPYTLTGTDKLHAMVTATRYIERYRIPGAIVECGVWRGGSMHTVVRTLQDVGTDDRDIYLFDTFEGMTEPTESDLRHDGQSAAQLMAVHGKDERIWARATLEDVQQGFEQFDYPSERIHFVKGKVEDTVPDAAPDQIAILRLDTDWYESTAHELEHLYPRLASGGVLMIDDYGWWQGSKKATDEFLDRTPEPLLLTRMDSGRVGVKP